MFIEEVVRPSFLNDLKKRDATFLSCVTVTRVKSSSLLNLNKKSHTISVLTESKLPVGSSQKRYLGCRETAPIRLILCCCPPES